MRLGFPGGSVVKNLPVNAGDMGLIPGSERSPREGNCNPFQYSCLGESHGQRSHEGYSRWDCKRVGHDLATKTLTKHMRLIMIKVKAHLGVKRVGGVGVLFHRGQGGSLWSLKSS